MTTRMILYADNGMILTNGEVYGKQIILAENDNPSEFYEISEEAYELHRQIIENENNNI